MIAAYLRISKEDSLKNGESESIVNQREIINDYIKSHNLLDVKYYIDDGYTGGNFNRPAFRKLINDIEVGIIDIIITKDTSRLGRDFIETSYYIFKYFPENGVRYIAILENFDTSIENGVEDIIPFKTIFNDMYLKDISKKIKTVRQSKMKKGLYMGSCVPYGYKRDKNNSALLIIDSYAATIVKSIFKMRASGKSIRSIAKYLTDNQILTPNIYSNRKINFNHSSNVWKTATVNKILENEVYIGNLIQHRYDKLNYKSKKKIKLDKSLWIKVEGAVEPIIDKDLYESVQKIKELYNNTKQKKYEYFLRGLVFCKECSCKMVVRRKKLKDTNIAYYCCKNNINYGNKVCTLHYFKEAQLNEIIINILIKLIENKNLKNNLEKLILNFKENKIKKLKKDKEKNISEYNKIYSKLYLDRLNNNITDVDFNILKNQLSKDNKNKELKLNKAILQIKNINCEQLVEKFLNLEFSNSVIINEFINKIEIDEEKKVYIYLNFKM